MPDFERRMANHEEAKRRRLERLRAVVRAPGGRDMLRAIRRASASRAPRLERRAPALVIAALFVGVLFVLLLIGGSR
jgi:ferric-dicitrate binding protein FerR (iron transport regulator)